MRAWEYMPGVSAAGHVTSSGWHPGRIDGCPKCPPPPCPVLYAPSGEVVGSASTEQGAIGCVTRRVQKQRNERWTATRKRRLDNSWAWFVGPQLIQGRRPR